jgi:hypothetical protein
MKSKDLTGQKFGRWTVIKRVEDRGTAAKPRKCYLCRCSCGVEKAVFSENLTGNKSLSCGCLKRERTSAAKFVNLNGKRFGRLLVLERAPGKRRWKQTAFWCQCDCGSKVVAIRAVSLVHGQTTSCGCLRREVTRKLKTTHGHTIGGKPSSLYQRYLKMKQRCYNENDPEFANYGGRGIGVCERWRESFEAYAADIARFMGPRPSSRHTIDRINNDGPYCPTNVHWATPAQQNRNKRSNCWYELNGVKLVQTDWARRFAVSDTTLSRWIKAGLTMTEIAARVGYLPSRKPPISVTVGAAASLQRKSS